MPDSFSLLSILAEMAICFACVNSLSFIYCIFIDSLETN